MKETSEQVINRIIDRLKDILKTGTKDEKLELVELLDTEDVGIYQALGLVEDSIQERFDMDWPDDEPAETLPEILKFPQKGTKKRAAKG